MKLTRASYRSKCWELEVQKWDDKIQETYDMRGEYKYCPSCGGTPAERIEYGTNGEAVISDGGGTG